jgi:hypothetical protein
MKSTFLSIAVVALLAALGLAQTPASSPNPDQTNIKGCLGGSDGNYTVVEDNTGHLFKITTSSFDLKPHLGHDVALIAHKASGVSPAAADGSFAVTELNMISEHCAEAAAAPAAMVTTPAETAAPPAADAAPPAQTATTPAAAAAAPAATATTPAETAAPPAADAAPPAQTATTPAAAASAPVETVSTPSETTTIPPVAAAAPAATTSPVVEETAGTPVVAAAAPAAAVSTPAETTVTPATRPRKRSATPAAATTTPAAAATTPAVTDNSTSKSAGTPPSATAPPATTSSPSSDPASTPDAAAPKPATTSRGWTLWLWIAFAVLLIVIGTGFPFFSRWRKQKSLERTGAPNLSFDREVSSDQGKIDKPSDKQGPRKAA